MFLQRLSFWVLSIISSIIWREKWLICLKCHSLFKAVWYLEAIFLKHYIQAYDCPNAVLLIILYNYIKLWHFLEEMFVFFKQMLFNYTSTAFYLNQIIYFTYYIRKTKYKKNRQNNSYLSHCHSGLRPQWRKIAGLVPTQQLRTFPGITSTQRSLRARRRHSVFPWFFVL